MFFSFKKITVVIIPILLLTFFIHSCLFAQVNQWAWMKGDNITEAIGNYGVQGISAYNNKPGARDFSVGWKDAIGNLWLFGGFEFNDLWKYNTSTNQWTWMKGDSVEGKIGVYGILGVASVANKPGGRQGSVSWTDKSGNFWLFGGYGYDAIGTNGTQYLNDLWKYDVSTNQWTWIKGSNLSGKVGVWGTQGVASSTNDPGARDGCRSWIDTSGNLWLFGGAGIDATTNYGYFNDLWKYNIATNQWTWINGNNTINQKGVYGIMGVSSLNNKPGSRWEATSWTDQSNNLWLFGGTGSYQATGNFVSGNYNDLWKYSPNANQWTWMKGDSTFDVTGNYGTLNVSSPNNKPGSREYSVGWTDTLGSLWLFGGSGYNTSSDGYLNDLWKYDIGTNQWSWINGSNTLNQYSIYGSQGIPSSSTKPGARRESVTWNDASGNFWLFGGKGFATNSSQRGYLSDMWRYNVYPTFTSVSSGNWNSPTTWVGGIVPSSNSIVIVKNAVSVQTNTTCYSLKVEGSSGSVTVLSGVQLMVLH